MMDNFLRIHDALASTTSINEKKEILRGADEVTKRFLRYTYDPFVNYYIKTIEDLGHHTGRVKDEALFFQTLDRLAAREVTGNIAREELAAVLRSYDGATAGVLKKVVRRDLLVGINVSTINAVFPGLIPKFEVMLAHKFEGKVATDLKFPVQAEYKLDGERTFAFYDGSNEPEYLSREGRPFDHLNGLFDDDLRTIYERMGRTPFVLDSEVMADKFVGVAKSKGKDATRDNLYLAAIDIHTLENWTARYCVTSQIERSRYLDSLTDPSLPKIRYVKKRICHNREELDAFYQEAVDAGYEGILIKDPNACYEWKRSYAWIKRKPEYPVDAVITGVFGGKPGTLAEGKFGYITVEGKDENGKPFACNVGSGVSKAVGAKMYADPNAYIGKYATLLCDSLSESEDFEETGIYSLRFPRFKKIRTDLA